jgi:hypothetical protein
VLTGFRPPGLRGTVTLLPRPGLGARLDAFLLLGLEFSCFVALALMYLLAFRIFALGQCV